MNKDIQIILQTWTQITNQTRQILIDEIRKLLLDPDGGFKLQPGETANIAPILQEGVYEQTGEFAWWGDQPCFFLLNEFGTEKDGRIHVEGSDESDSYAFLEHELSTPLLISILTTLDTISEDIMKGQLTIDSEHNVQLKE